MNGCQSHYCRIDNPLSREKRPPPKFAVVCVGSSGGRSMSKSHHFLHNDFVVLWWQKGDPIKLPK